MPVSKKCKPWHNLDKDKHKFSPTLVGLIGGKAGTAKDAKGKLYRYSRAMTAVGAGGIVWNTEILEKYLTKPKKLIPKIKMSFPSLKNLADRIDVLLYIESKMK